MKHLVVVFADVHGAFACAVAPLQEVPTTNMNATDRHTYNSQSRNTSQLLLSKTRKQIAR